MKTVILKNAKPILFDTELVGVILNGRKTQTRRVIKPQPDYCKMTAAGPLISHKPIYIKNGLVMADCGTLIKTKYLVGDILFVRETWAIEPSGCYIFRSDYLETITNSNDISYLGNKIKWKPLNHMPKEAARIFLKVTNIRVEQLEDISELDCVAEGCFKGMVIDGGKTPALTAKQAYMWLWNRLNTKSGYLWCLNPWVFVYEFERVNICLNQ